MKAMRHGVIGLAVDERGISCAQLALRSRGAVVQKLARLDFSQGMTVDQPEAAGQLLRAFLDQHHFEGHGVYVGVPAKWVIAQLRQLPPIDAGGAVAMLQLQSERMAVEEMVFDVAGVLGGSAASQVLLVGILKRQQNHIEQICRTAQLKLVGICPTALAMAQPLSAEGRPLVMMGRLDDELVWQQQGVPLLLKHLGGADDGEAQGGAQSSSGRMTTMLGEVRRTLMMSSRPGDVPRGLLVWSEQGPGQFAGASSTVRDGLPVEFLQLQNMSALLGLSVSDEAGDAKQLQALWPAIAVGMLAGRPNSGNVNFVQPRLVTPKSRHLERPMLLGGVAIVIILLGLAGLYYSVVSREGQAKGLQSQLDELKPQVKQAEANLDRFSFGRSFYQQRPPALDCLRDIATAFGTDSSIWATGFLLRDNRKGSLMGKAVSHPSVLALLDRLKTNGRLTDLQLGQSTGSSSEVTFSINFIYIGGADAQ